MQYPRAGFKRKHVLYTVSTKTTLSTFGAPSAIVTRRFSDFVQLCDLLKVRPFPPYSCPYSCPHALTLVPAPSSPHPNPYIWRIRIRTGTLTSRLWCLWLLLSRNPALCIAALLRHDSTQR